MTGPSNNSTYTQTTNSDAAFATCSKPIRLAAQQQCSREKRQKERREREVDKSVPHRPSCLLYYLSRHSIIRVKEEECRKVKCSVYSRERGWMLRCEIEGERAVLIGKATTLVMHLVELEHYNIENAKSMLYRGKITI